MPLIAYIDKSELDRIYHSMDGESKEICTEILSLTGQRYMLREIPYWQEIRRLFRKKEMVYSPAFQVLFEVDEFETQIINLAGGMTVPRNEALAFLIGIRCEAWKQYYWERCQE